MRKSGKTKSQAQRDIDAIGARGPASLNDLHPAPYNPRVIGEDELARLQTSLFRYGDISGIVWNARTGNVVTGHQRIRALQEKHGGALALDVGACALAVPGGETFPIRVVDWDLPTEKAANVAGNSQDVTGRWDPQKLADLIADMAVDGLTLDDAMMTAETMSGIMGDVGIERPDGEQSGSSPWDRMNGEAQEGILVSIGDVVVRISSDAYEVFSGNCPESGIKEYVEGLLTK